ncbi:methylmalonyl-CoA epimerase [Ferrithrix thermotolerans DSM 19514]|jgi:methylmalonyl-CoA/ethylmalonyl-CoA epimerase|uniref:Methylmalonyl-CoA epimerase n=1 Tax=Ferrithrix thermotolerans DSM 19514 TaxID=1121881 RepID=A0A1M4UZD7_9ACTN|nr:methylmalonyl-CoA epimerase [Ferrithrix thermotolerans]SHE62086.1 methylmalonyl-CoA epimerase [Ferrithrix thermotolerans DSM 19514]
MKPQEIDHIAIAVRDLDSALELYTKILGGEIEHREFVQSDGIEEVLLRVSDTYIQLLCPTTTTSPVAKYIDKHGEGLHHIGLRVDDCAQALADSLEAGATGIDAKPRPGSRNTLVAFLHPKSTHGVLIELVQPPNSDIASD